MEASTRAAAVGLAQRERPAPATLLDVRRQVGAPPAAVFALLRDLDGHWRLAGRAFRVLELHGPRGRRHGGRVRLLGPCGVRRTVTTRVTCVQPGATVAGTARTASGTTVHVAWRLRPRGAGTQVHLELAAEGAGAVDATLLRLGGRRWLRRRLQAAVGRLAEAAEAGS